MQYFDPVNVLIFPHDTIVNCVLDRRETDRSLK